MREVPIKSDKYYDKIFSDTKIRVSEILKNFESYSLIEKQEIVERYWNLAFLELERSNKIILKKLRKNPDRNARPYIRGRFKKNIIANSVFYYAYISITLYSKMNGDWEKIREGLKEISLYLWSVNQYKNAYRLFEPVKENPDWNFKYRGKSRNANPEFHPRASIKIKCVYCTREISESNYTKHQKSCKKIN